MFSDPLDGMIAQEELSQLHSAIRVLPENERLVFRMIAVEGISEKDTSHCIALPAAKVRRALARAREMLKARLA